jgi:hypothetical protein
MKTSIQPPDIASAVETAFETIPRARDQSSGSSPGTGASIRKTINLSRPWNFPAAHADSFISRRYFRSDVQVPVEVFLSRLDGSPFDKGTGVIRNLSFSGLCLDDVFLSHGRILAAYFEVQLRPVMEPSGLATIAGRILRTSTSGLPCFGIEFTHPEAGAERRLHTLR